jgi:predicted RNA-binding protein YlxR (DUF448 family)
VVARHVPERTCVACRHQQPKRLLVRIVRAADGRVAVDPTGKRSGRGAYLCREAACWETGLRKDLLARALKTTLSSEDRSALDGQAASIVEGRSEDRQATVQKE